LTFGVAGIKINLMSGATKDLFTFLLISLLSIIFLSWTFYSIYFSLKFYWSWKDGFVDLDDVVVPLFRLSFYCFGLILSMILPFHLLQKLLAPISYLVILLSPFFISAYIFCYDPVSNEPRFFFLGKYEIYSEFTFGILESFLLMTLGLSFMGFIRGKIRGEG
jgi:Kef-type K+ transport system membrane component KefB